ASTTMSTKRSSPSAPSPRPHDSSSDGAGSRPHTSGPRSRRTAAKREAKKSATTCSVAHRTPGCGIPCRWHRSEIPPRDGASGRPGGSGNTDVAVLRRVASLVVGERRVLDGGDEGPVLAHGATLETEPPQTDRLQRYA